MEPLRVVCIDDSNRPNEVPTTRWVKKDENYTIVKVNKMNIQGGVLGCQLAEIDNSDLFPYTHFALSRFRPLTEDETMAEKSVEELIKEIELTPQIDYDHE
jgi:hypothetical protein